MKFFLAIKYGEKWCAIAFDAILQFKVAESRYLARCILTDDMEIDHITAWAEGGATLEQNLRVLCSSHNKFLAEKRFSAGYKKGRSEGL